MKRVEVDRFRIRGLLSSRNALVVGLAAVFTLGLSSAAHPANVITVDTLADTTGPSGTCSLRAAIFNANGHDQSGSTNCTAGSVTNTINISVTGTIALASALPTVTGNLTIVGPASPRGDHN